MYNGERIMSHAPQREVHGSTPGLRSSPQVLRIAAIRKLRIRHIYDCEKCLALDIGRGYHCINRHTESWIIPFILY